MDQIYIHIIIFVVILRHPGERSEIVLEPERYPSQCSQWKRYGKYFSRFRRSRFFFFLTDKKKV